MKISAEKLIRIWGRSLFGAGLLTFVAGLTYSLLSETVPLTYYLVWGSLSIAVTGFLLFGAVVAPIWLFLKGRAILAFWRAHVS